MYEFTEDCMIHIEQIDNEHRKLFQMLNEAFTMVQETEDVSAITISLLSNLKNYAMTHFAHEEAYMESIHYDGLEAQKRVHEAFVDKLNSLDLNDMENRQDEYLDELLNFLLDWLKNHIMKMDKKIPQK